MNPRISKEIYRWYFRLMGQTNVAQNNQLEVLLLAYTSILTIIGLWVSYVYCIYPMFHEDEGFFISITISVWQFLDYGYEIGHVLMCGLSIVQRGKENEILMELQNIQNALRSLLIHRTTNERKKPRQMIWMVDFLYHYYWLLEGAWLITQILMDNMDLDLDFEYIFYYLLPRLTVTSIYLQTVVFSWEVLDALAELHGTATIYLQEKAKTSSNHSSNGAQRKFGEILIHISGQNHGVVIPGLHRHQWQCFVTMKWIYSKILLVSKLGSRLYGFRLFFVHFLCLLDFTEACYILTIAILKVDFEWSFIVKLLFPLLPNVIKFIYLCRVCDKISQMTSAILSKLTSSPMKSPLLDDFILQIRQNPIKFTAYDFYELNSETLTQVSVIVFDLMLFLLQIFSLTNIA